MYYYDTIYDMLINAIYAIFILYLFLSIVSIVYICTAFGTRVSIEREKNIIINIYTFDLIDGEQNSSS